MNRRHHRRKRRSTRDSGDNVLGLLLIAITVALVGGLGIAWYNSAPRVKINDTDLCPVTGPTGAVVFVIDTTDELTAFQKATIQSQVSNIVSNAKAGTYFSFSIVSPDSKIRSVQRFGICKPPAGTDADDFFENERIFTRRFEIEFVSPLESELNNVLNFDNAESSPIMETIQSAVVGIFSDLSLDSNRVLIVASDLLQHSDAFSFYRGGNWSSFERSNSYPRLGRNLTDVDVLLLQIPRPKVANLQGPQLLEFWWNYFDVQGANTVKLDVLGDL